jgi:hypothetical protein
MMKRNTRNIFGLFLLWERNKAKTRNSKLEDSHKHKAAEIRQT